MDRTVLWVARVAWLLLPVTVGAAASRAGSDTSTAIHIVAAVELWALWAAGLVAALVPTTASLTVLRLLAPAPVLVAAVALVAHPDLDRRARRRGRCGRRGRRLPPWPRPGLLPGLGLRRRSPLPAPPARRARPRSPPPAVAVHGRGDRRRAAAAGRPAVGSGRRRDAHRRPRAGRAPPPLPPAVAPVPGVRTGRPGRPRPPRPGRDRALPLDRGAVGRAGALGHDGARSHGRGAGRRARGDAGRSSRPSCGRPVGPERRWWWRRRRSSAGPRCWTTALAEAASRRAARR